MRMSARDFNALVDVAIAVIYGALVLGIAKLAGMSLGPR